MNFKTIFFRFALNVMNNIMIINIFNSDDSNISYIKSQHHNNLCIQNLEI